MPIKTNDQRANNDKAIDRAAKGGGSLDAGNADANHNISHPYNDDIQTQLAAKSHKNKSNDKNKK